MSSKSNALETGWLNLLFNNSVAASSILDDVSDGIDASPTAGNLFVSLHTDDPGEAGDQTTSEATFTNYARVSVARTSGGWTVSGNNVSNTATVAFPQAGAGSPEDVKFFGVGTDTSGAGNLLYSGHLGETALAFVAEADNETLTVKNHSFVDNDEVFVYEIPGVALPTGLSRGLYFVITPSGDDLTLESTLGGGAVNITADGAGNIAKVVKKTVDPNDTVSFAAGDLDIFED